MAEKQEKKVKVLITGRVEDEKKVLEGEQSFDAEEADRLVNLGVAKYTGSKTIDESKNSK